MSSADPFASYRHLLDAYCADALAVARRFGAEVGPAGAGNAARQLAWLTALVCRAASVSRYLAGLPATAEERSGGVGPALERVLLVYASHPLDAAEYARAVEAEIDGEDEREDWDADLWDELGGLREADAPVLDRDIVGRPAAALVGELCRDLGAVLARAPAAWLEALSPALCRYCVRAARAAIRPAPSGGRIGHLMER